MSRANVIVALVVALLLGGVTIFVTTYYSPPAAPPAAPMLDFAPAAVTEVRIARKDGSVQRLLRGAQPGEWRLVASDADGGGWPVMPTPVRAGLRLLSTLELETGGEKPPPLDEDAAAVAVVLDDGTERTVRFGSRPLGGRVPAEISTPDGTAQGWAGADLAAAFITSGPLHWRDPAALPLAGPETARVWLTSSDRSIALARVQGRWSVREPIAAPADPEVVGKLLAALAGARIVDFLDDPDAAALAAGLDPPTASAVIEADHRVIDGADVASRTVRNEMHVGSPADLAGKTLFARVVRSAEGGPSEGDVVIRTVVAETGSLASLSTDPAAYIARTAIQIPPGDVAEVRLIPEVEEGGGSARTFRRELDHWTMLDAGGEPAQIPSERAAGIDQFLTVLAGTDAAGVQLAMPEGFEAVTTAELRDLSGNLVAAPKVGVVPAADGPALVVGAGDVWRTYAAEASEPVLRWLAELAL